MKAYSRVWPSCNVYGAHFCRAGYSWSIPAAGRCQWAGAARGAVLPCRLAGGGEGRVLLLPPAGYTVLWPWRQQVTARHATTVVAAPYHARHSAGRAASRRARRPGLPQAALNGHLSARAAW